MAPENILEKVQKLLDLQVGAIKIGSLQEAQNAAEKVQRLLTKYNLEMADVELHSTKNGFDIKSFNFDDIRNKKNESKWIFQLYHTLCFFNYSRFVITNRFDSEKHGYYQTGVIVGSKMNVEVVRKLGLRLEERIRTFEKEAWKKNGIGKYKNRNAWKRAYFMGAVKGLTYQLRRARDEEEKENSRVTALVIQNEQELMDALTRIFPNLIHKKGKSTQLSNSEAYYKGFRDGADMSIREHIK